MVVHDLKHPTESLIDTLDFAKKMTSDLVSKFKETNESIRQIRLAQMSIKQLVTPYLPKSPRMSAE